MISLKEVIEKVFGVEKGNVDKSDIVYQINRFKSSKKYSEMLVGEAYYKGDHDILKVQRTVIGDNGVPTVVGNIPNNRIVDNQYRKMVVQKNNYLLAKPIVFKSEDEVYSNELGKVFSKRFNRTIKNLGEDSLNFGIGYLFFGYDGNGDIEIRRLKPYEVIPIWDNQEHEVLEKVIRVYQVSEENADSIKTKEMVEVYTKEGIDYFENQGGVLKAVEPYHRNYFSIEGNEYNWDRLPIIAFKYNADEIPLIRTVKSLQDGMNKILSNFQNNMEEDARNTILVLVNYDGENLGEFRRNLATYGAVKIRNTDGNSGDVRTLQVEVNAENYKYIIGLFKKAIIENAMGYDAKDDRFSGNANQLNIMSMYSDIELDANGMEMEYQASFEQLLWFVEKHLRNTGKGDFEGARVEVIFNRDMLMNESEIIENLNKSVGIISKETIVANHPWINDLSGEIKRIEKENINGK